ncbi:hypothetical protein ACIO3S_06405 [Nocardioides sp. NPDC087217]|uniref:hypothetical protein n=1 Tax=Nocardioides sp. NPDC087217 TaxID=3364335 RepID=UPI0038154DB0
MRTLLLDCPFDLPGADAFTFMSYVSVFDYDLVMWDPGGTARKLASKPYQAQHRGGPQLDAADSVAFMEALVRRQTEFGELLALGKTLIVFATPPKVFWVETGKRETSGTGRNQKVTNFVEDVDLLMALPVPYKAMAGTGIELELAADVAGGLWRATKGEWVYRCTLETFPGKAILRVANVDKVVGSVEIRENGGVFALLPEPWIEPEVEDEDDTNDEDDEDETTQENRDAAAETEDPLLVPKAIYAWAVGLSVGEDEPFPEWCMNLLLHSEAERQNELVQVETSMAELATKLEELKAAQAGDAQWKRLIVSQGEALERQVQAAFELLGFEVLDTQRGRSDLRLNYNGKRVVVEVKGLGKSAGEKHAAQLEKWVAEELAGDVEAKGILVVNAWKDIPLKDRSAAFPDQMLEYAKARGHCLLTGLQLLNMCVTVRNSPAQAQSMADQLLSTVGPVAEHEDPSKIFATPASIQPLAD